MNIESPDWERWESAFLALAEEAEKVAITPNIHGSRHFLCLYGENGLSPEDEFAELDKMSRFRGELKKVEVDSSYWQDIVLFVP